MRIKPTQEECIRIVGASQNNLKGLDVDIPLGKITVLTGVSGSGKSSLAFDILYAEGQRRYVETFSPYARQFLDRMDKPRVDRIEGIPPAIAIDQTNTVRASRSTVGTMTELSDHLKLLFARAARLHCRQCAKPVQGDTPLTVFQRIMDLQAASSLPTEWTITFPVSVPHNFSDAEAESLLSRQGYSRLFSRRAGCLEVIQDRLPFSVSRRSRILDDLEKAFRHGQGRVNLHAESAPDPMRFSIGLHCPDCDIAYRNPTQSLFSFNSPIGACEKCRGFGRTISIDYGLVIPDNTRTLKDGAIRPWQSESYRECQDDMMSFARQRGIPTGVAWRDLTQAQQRWVLDGEGRWEDGVWYGVSRFFGWLESKSYRMHIRVLLSKYRAYQVCPECGGSRLKPDALLWRIGPGNGLTLQDIALLPIGECHRFFRKLALPAPLDEASKLLLDGIRTRLGYLVEVGLDYLTLDRQSRTLSGGEVQRINLTTALGTSLVNTLFVLDEPSIGLHPRNIHRLIGILHRLRDAGNTLVIVEHDPDVIAAADRVLDLGPGPGERGGQIVFSGPLPELLACRSSLTADYLSGRRTVGRPEMPVPPTRWLEITGAAEHNLKNIDVRIPLNRLVCITGVSGSGKSTLIQDVCYPAIRRAMRLPTEAPGRHSGLRGWDQMDEVILVDQSPIGKTTRSNPASYVGVFDRIRRLFAGESTARRRGYTAGTFSFNSGNGRCPACGGNGFQHVEMQFLSDVYLRCPDCAGRRYRHEILDVKLFGRHSVADVLDLTVAEACVVFAAYEAILQALRPLMSVGLDYLHLGQPVPTLSGGEAQRLKLAGHLSEHRSRSMKGGRGTLFLFDEPTTGLHSDDIGKLLRALRELLNEGHSVVVIEHNLDLIRTADWIIDLGPEGGDAGGYLVCEGTPIDVAACAQSHTGTALRGMHTPPCSVGDGSNTAEKKARQTHPVIRVHNAREHNLKNINVTLPLNALSVITGISGSGKSTLAFDILFAEGQRRYLESINAYARQFVQPASRPDVDAIFGIPPTVAIEQRTSRGGRKSTVATTTEIYHFLRLLFVKLGIQHCPDCRIAIRPQTPDAILASLMKTWLNRPVALLAPLVVARKGLYTDLAAWALSKGYRHLRVDGAMIPTGKWPRLDRFREHNIELPVGRVRAAPEYEAELRVLLGSALQFGRGAIMAVPDGGAGSAGSRLSPAPAFYSIHRSCPGCHRNFPEMDPRLFSFNSRHGWCQKCFGTGLHLPGFDEEQTGEEIAWNAWWEGAETACPSCHGRRLREEALSVTFRTASIADITALSVDAARKYFDRLALEPGESEIGRDIVREIHSRLEFLSRVGLPYLTLDRAAPTLSGGEAQRIRLASQLGSNLRGVCYILDEPTIGLHPRDNRLLLDTLHELQTHGNTVILVEHDEETIRRADHIVDLGPGAGVDGGRVVCQGSLQTLLRHPESLTGRCLRNPMKHPLTGGRRPVQRTPEGHVTGPCLTVVNARMHNLKALRIPVPLNRLVCVTGVSGSGKSTLVRNVLHGSLSALHRQARSAGRRTRRACVQVVGCDALLGHEGVDRVMEVDQTPIGKTPRSCPATYVGFWDDIRRLFAETPEARLRGYGPARFSFNVPGGRCDACEGQGVRRIEMSFLPDVTVPCEVCEGRRFTPDTLGALFKERSIAEVLAMSVDEASVFFASQPPIHSSLRLLQEVGLGYMKLGQQSPTLSGGEAQRIKLVTELARCRSGRSAVPEHQSLQSPPSRERSQKSVSLSKAGRANRSGNGGTLYVLDEPTIGLHMADVEKLVRVLHRLVDAGNSVVVIEHNLDMMAEADWIIDMGPDGGESGGEVVAAGTPEDLTSAPPSRSWTAGILAKYLSSPRRRK